jgi:uncharacterized protein (DUF2384 family)
MTECSGIDMLVAQVRTMVRESGDLTDFDSEAWVRRWLERPHPALGGRRPAEFMDTREGRNQVSDLLARQQSGAYG